MRKYQTPDLVSSVVEVLCNTPNPDKAIQLLFDLYQENQLYYVPDDEGLILVYSHAEIADQSAICADGVDFLHLLANHYMSGNQFVILNPTMSDIGLHISIRGFMKRIYTDLLQSPELYFAPFADDIEVLHALNTGEDFSVAWKPNGSYVLVWQNGVKAERPPRKAIIEQCDLARLIELIPSCRIAPIRIYTQHGMIDTTARALLAACHACGLTEENTSRDGLDQISLAPIDADWEYADRILAKELEPITLDIVEEPKAEVVQLSKAKKFLKKLFEKKPSSTEEGIAVIDTEVASDIKSRFKLSGKTISACVFAVVFAIIAMTIAWKVLTPTPLEAVQEIIRVGDYGSLPESYTNCITSDPGNKEALLSLMIADLDDKIAGYAANTVTTEEIAKVLVTYQKIPAMKDRANAAYHTASALEQSKIAYRKGLAASSIFTRLTHWRSVTKADTGSNAAMVENLTINAEVYKDQALSEIQNQSDKTALSNLYLFQSFYEKDEDISMRITELQMRAFSSTTADPNDKVGIVGAKDVMPRWDQAPIVISKFKIKQVGFEGWNVVYIDWGNRTEKEILSVVFEIYAYDHAGNCMSTTIDTGDGLYSKYQAKFEGPFASGEMVQGFYFQNVWCNPNIVSARVDAVIITYTDGTITTFFNQSDVAGLFAI